MEWKRRTAGKAWRTGELWTLYENSFPLHEQRMWEDQEKALEDSAYFCMEIWENHALAGLLWYWDWGELCYVEHFAVAAQLRGKGTGSRVLKEFCTAHPLVVLEIDPPVNETSCRRERFYCNNGFFTNSYDHSHPPYRVGHKAHPLTVMSFPRVLSQEEFQRFSSLLWHQAMKYSQAGETGDIL